MLLSPHLLAGYDTTPRGELLVSTFTAAMHRNDLFGPQWDFWAATSEPIDALRTRIGVTA